VRKMIKNKKFKTTEQLDSAPARAEDANRQAPSLQEATQACRKHFDNQLNIERVRDNSTIFVVTRQDQSRDLIDAVRDGWDNTWHKLQDREYVWTTQELLECLAEMKLYLRMFVKAGLITQEQFIAKKADVVTMVESWLSLICQRDGKSSMTIQILMRSRAMAMPEFEPYSNSSDHLH